MLARRLYEGGKCKQALRKLTLLLHENPEFAEAHRLKGAVLRQLGKLSAARGSVELALKLDPSDPRAWYDLAHIRQKSNQFDLALEAIDRALELARRAKLELNAFYLLRGSILSRLGLAQDAIQVYREALQLDPEFSEARYALGRLLFRAGEIESAVEHLERAAILRPGAPEMRNLLGDLWRQQGDLGKSAREYLSAQKLNPASAVPYRKLGSLFLQHDLPSEALRFFRIASYLEPENIRNYLKIIAVYLRLRRYAEAVEVIHRAREIEPDRPDLAGLLKKLEKRIATASSPARRNHRPGADGPRQAVNPNPR